jgi:hypothetical protein
MSKVLVCNPLWICQGHEPVLLPDLNRLVLNRVDAEPGGDRLNRSGLLQWNRKPEGEYWKGSRA